MQRRMLIVIGALVLLAAACDWPHARGGPALTGVQTSESQISAANVASLALAWIGQRTAADDDANGGRLAVHAGRVGNGVALYETTGVLGCTPGSPKTCNPMTNFGELTNGVPRAAPTFTGNQAFAIQVTNGAQTPRAAMYTFSGEGGCSDPCTADWFAAADTGDQADRLAMGGIAEATISNGLVVVPAGVTQRLRAYDALGVTNCHASFSFPEHAVVVPACFPIWASAGRVLTANPVAVVGGVAYLAGSTNLAQADVGGLLAYTANGTGPQCSGTPVRCIPLWRGDLGSGAADPLLLSDTPVVGGRVYVATATDLRVFDTSAPPGSCSGTPVVCAPLFAVPTGPRTQTHASSIAIANGRVYVPIDGGAQVFDAADGTLLATLLSGATGGVVRHHGGVTLANGVAYLGDRAGLSAFDATLTDGCAGVPKVCSPLWRGVEGMFATSPAVVNGWVYTSTLPDGKVRAFHHPT